MTNSDQLAALAAEITELTVAAGAIALDYFNDGGKTRAEISYKAGGSPVSEADMVVDTFLRNGLLALLPDAGWLSEETADDPTRLGKKRLFIVDPIDGTRAFINGDRRWGVSVAFVEDGRPAIGIVHMPALAQTFTAAKDSGAMLNGRQIFASIRPQLRNFSIAGPRKATEALEKDGLAMDVKDRIPSLAYRLALVGSAGLDAALASTSAWDWDIAAADLIVHESGGRLTGLDNHMPLYNQPIPRHGILAAAGAQLHGPLLAALNALVPS